MSILFCKLQNVTSNNQRLWSVFERKRVINRVGEKYSKIKSFREGNRISVAAPFRKLQRTYLNVRMSLLESASQQRTATE